MCARRELTDREHRTSRDLGGTWEFVTDPDAAGVERAWHDPDARWPDRSVDVEVPHAWQELDEYEDYTGTAWYRRTFEHPAPGREDARVFVRFGAVDHEATVWVDGERVGHNRGGYLPFEVDVTEALEEGSNVLTVAVTDPEDLSEVPHGKQGAPWYMRVSGIWQSPSVHVRPGTRVVDARVTPDIDTDAADVALDVEAGSRDAADLRAEVRAHREDERVASATVDLAEATEAVLDFEDPDYWSPDSPALYDLEVVLSADGTVLDRYEDYFGMRSFETDGEQFLLNGEPITMRGVLDQGYYPETLYRPFESDLFERELELARELGFNLVRKHIKPAHPAFLELADRTGMLVWQEPANPSTFTERSTAAVEAQLRGMVARDYNRPSVVVWSLYNEEWGIGHDDDEESLWTDEEKQRHLADLYDEMRELDPTRLVCDNSGWAHVRTDVNDYHRYFVSPDRAGAWEDDLDHVCHHPGDNYATRELDDVDAPIVVSEFGTWGLCDLGALRERYGGDPPWFDHEFLTEPLKRPAGVDERFAETDLPDVFGDYETLAAAWQAREFVSLKHLVEQMRVREDLAGYVLTQFSDLEWEFNGVLDYRREEKAFHDEFAAVNAPVAVVAEPSSHVLWADDAATVDVTVVNDGSTPLTGTLEWDAFGRSGSTDVSVDPHGTTRLDELFAVEPASVEGFASADLTVTFDAGGDVWRTTEPLTAVAPSARTVADATVFAEGELASSLATAGFEVTHDLTAGVDVAFVETIDAAVDRFATEGGAVVQVADRDGEMAGGGPYTFRSLPRTESWNLVASLLYQDTDLLDGLCDGPRLGWEFEGVYPHAVATNLDATVDSVHVGYVEGWLANWASPLVTRGHGNGTVTACTFPVRDVYGSHPTATVLCERLVRRLAR